MSVNFNNIGHDSKQRIEQAQKKSEQYPQKIDDKQGSTPQSAAPSDSVLLTEQSRQLVEMEKQLTSVDTDRAERIAEIKQALADGNYKIDPERVAKKMFKFEVNLEK